MSTSVPDKSVESAKPLPSTGHRKAYTLLILLFSVVLLAFIILPVVYEIRTPMEKADYHIFYTAGVDAMSGETIYTRNGGRQFAFTYPLFAAVGFFGPLSLLGNYGFVATFAFLNACAWAASIFIGVKLATGHALRQHPLLYLIPALLTIPMVWTTFFLGQINLILLALMAAGFLLLRQQKPRSAAIYFALAASLKAFPVLVLGYLIWRKEFQAAIGMVIWIGVLSVGLPMLVRGYDQSIEDNRTWVHSILLNQSEGSIGERGYSRSLREQNQSLQAVVMRLTHKMNAVRINDKPIHVHIIDLTQRQSYLLFLSIGLLIAIAYFVVLPEGVLRTPTTDAIEQAMLLCLIVIASPLAWGYYFCWLLIPLIVLLHHIGEIPEGERRRTIWLIVYFVLGCLPFIALELPIVRHLHAMGTSFWAAFGICVALGYWLRRCVRYRHCSQQRKPMNVPYRPGALD